MTFGGGAGSIDIGEAFTNGDSTAEIPNLKFEKFSFRLLLSATSSCLLPDGANACQLSVRAVG